MAFEAVSSMLLVCCMRALLAQVLWSIVLIVAGEAKNRLLSVSGFFSLWQWGSGASGALCWRVCAFWSCSRPSFARLCGSC